MLAKNLLIILSFLTIGGVLTACDMSDGSWKLNVSSGVSSVNK